MKTAIILAAAAAALAVPRADAQGLSAFPDERDLYHPSSNGRQVIIFEECQHKPGPACKGMITKAVRSNRDLFGGRGRLNFLTIPVRSANESEYWKIFLRTDVSETYVEGVLGDGMVFYPHEWCSDGSDGYGGGCANIGPWDCDLGSPLLVQDCCDLIQADYPGVDVNGNTLECFPDFPIGSPSNPIDEDRVIIHIDAEGNVAHPPRNE